MARKVLKDNNIDQFINELEKVLKPLNSPNDLVRVGVFKSSKTAANHRSAGTGPDFIKGPGMGVAYPKQSVLSWLRKKVLFVRRVGYDQNV